MELLLPHATIFPLQSSHDPTQLEEPALGHAELKEAAINGGGNAQQADADGGLGLNWGAGGGGPQHQGTVGKQKCR